MNDSLRSIVSISSSGRASRSAFFLGTVGFIVAMTLLVSLFDRYVVYDQYVAWVTTADIQVTFVASLGSYAAAFAALFLGWLLFWGYWMLVIRRLHDLGYHGAASLYLLLPGVNVIVTIILCLWPGRARRNRFDETPEEEEPEVLDPDPYARRDAESKTESSTAVAVKEADPVAPNWGDDVPPEAKALLARLAADMEGENLSIRLQLKVRTVEKLRRLVRDGKLTQEAFLRLERYVQTMGG